MARRIGALWKNKSKDNKAYLAGYVDAGLLGKVKLGIFKNEKKTGDTQPDYHILLSEPKPQEEPEDEVPF